MLLINSSVKQDNNTGVVIADVCDHLHDQPHSIVTMVQFETFSGEYITSTRGLESHAANLIQTLATHQDHLYFVPTYYKSMPGAFKNFLDIVQMKSLWAYKRIGIFSTNAKNQDYGARQFMQSLFGILEFHQAVAVVVPQILILNPDNVDRQAFCDYLNYFHSFPVPSP